jgi:chromatin remodeling complex protein RSC6
METWQRAAKTPAFNTSYSRATPLRWQPSQALDPALFDSASSQASPVVRMAPPLRPSATPSTIRPSIEGTPARRLPSRRGTRNRPMTDNEHLTAIRIQLEMQEFFGQSSFWPDVTHRFELETGTQHKTLKRTLSKLAADFKAWAEGEGLCESGRENETELVEARRQWLQFETDYNRRIATQKAGAAQQVDERRRADRHRDDMRRRQGEKRRQQDSDEVEDELSNEEEELDQTTAGEAKEAEEAEETEGSQRRQTSRSTSTSSTQLRQRKQLRRSQDPRLASTLDRLVGVMELRARGEGSSVNERIKRVEEKIELVSSQLQTLVGLLQQEREEASLRR